MFQIFDNILGQTSGGGQGLPNPDYFQQEHQSLKTVGVCLIVPPIIYLVLQPRVNSPVNNIVVRSSCLPGERDKTKTKSGQIR